MHLLAAGHDGVVQSVKYAEALPILQNASVASAKPAIFVKHRCAVLWIVSGHHRRALYPYLGVSGFYLETIQRFAAGRIIIGTVKGLRAYLRTAFGESVGKERSDTPPGGSYGEVRIRRPPADESKSKVSGRAPLRVTLQHPFQHRWYEGHLSHSIFLYGTHELVFGEASVQNDTGPREEATRDNGKASDVCNRERGQPAVV